MNLKQVVIATGAAFVLSAPALGADEPRSPGQHMDPQTIRQVQQALQDKGQNVGDVDGIMGPRTQAALRQYQESQGMPATGRVDRQTVSSLGLSRAAAGASGSATGSRSPSGTGSTGSGPSTRPGG